VNWLTARVAELETFKSLYDSAFQLRETPMRQLPFKYLRDALLSYGVQSDLDRVQELADYAYLYIEDGRSAAIRIKRARTVNWGEPPGIGPLLFTTAVNDRHGSVLYLPDDDTDKQDVQLFTPGELSQISRLRLTGDLTPSSADLTRASLLTPEVCSDGPCAEWGDECGGNGCRCHKFPDVELRVRARLAQVMRLRRSQLKVSVLKCHRDQ
jgi:hypothetical protein